jgi:hypothetical protein
MHFQLQVTLPYTGLMYIAIIKLEVALHKRLLKHTYNMQD